MKEIFPGLKPDALMDMDDKEFKSCIHDAIGLDLMIGSALGGVTPYEMMADYRNFLAEYNFDDESEREIHLKVVDRLLPMLKK